MKISTFDSGTCSVRSFVASSPSMPGIRTSMITTSGLRRSASSTAEAPSAASPTTRMCGARESESRSPSRTTSWSSTISVVISSAMWAILCGKEGQLFGALRRPQRSGRRSRIPCAFASRRTRLRGPASACGEIRAARVEPLVVRQELGPVAGEALEEVLARARA